MILEGHLSFFGSIQAHAGLSPQSRRGRVTNRDIQAFAECLVSDTVLCLILSTILYLWDGEIQCSKYFDSSKFPEKTFVSWVSSSGADLDYAWNHCKNKRQDMFEWRTPTAIAAR
jgi:hypothetical protein